MPPKITPFQFGDEPMNFGEPVSVQCTISGGDWPIDVSWTLNGQPISDNLDIVMSKFTRHTYVLGIDSVNAKQAGNYSCLATNKAGRAEHSAVLIVNGLWDTFLCVCILIMSIILSS